MANAPPSLSSSVPPYDKPGLNFGCPLFEANKRYDGGTVSRIVTRR